MGRGCAGGVPGVCGGLGEELTFALETGAQLFGQGDRVTEAGDTWRCPCTPDTARDLSLTWGFQGGLVSCLRAREVWSPTGPRRTSVSLDKFLTCRGPPFPHL